MVQITDTSLYQLNNLKQITQYSFMNYTTLYQANDGSAVKCASNRSGWCGTTRWGTPGSLVKLCNTIITHPSLISHPSSPSTLTERYSPCNYYHSWRPNGGIGSLALQKMSEGRKKRWKRTARMCYDHLLHSIGIGSLKVELRRASVVNMSTSLHHFLKPVCNIQIILFAAVEQKLPHLPLRACLSDFLRYPGMARYQKWSSRYPNQWHYMILHNQFKSMVKTPQTQSTGLCGIMKFLWASKHILICSLHYINIFLLHLYM